MAGLGGRVPPAYPFHREFWFGSQPWRTWFVVTRGADVDALDGSQQRPKRHEGARRHTPEREIHHTTP